MSREQTATANVPAAGRVESTNWGQGLQIAFQIDECGEFRSKARDPERRKECDADGDLIPDRGAPKLQDGNSG